MTSLLGRAAESRESALGRRLGSVRLMRLHDVVALGAAWAGSAAWVWARLDQGWVPHDDGAFGQSALRVLHGQLPHREFAELYTGGLTFVDAGAMWVFGEDLVSLRYPLFGVFLLLVPAAYYIARRFAPPWIAALTVAGVVTWSIPVYPAAMPSWYLLVFSVCGAACLVRWRETERARWLFACGLLAGLAITFKIVGVYLVAAVLLFLLVVHRRQARRLRIDVAGALGALGAAGLTASVLGSRYGISEVLEFVVPIAAVLAAMIAIRRRSPVPAVAAAGSLVRSFLVLGAGVSLPVAALAAPYLVAGATGDLVEGVFVSPQSRRDVAYSAVPAIDVVPAIVLVGLVVLAWRARPELRRRLDYALAAFVGLVVVLAGSQPGAYRLGFAIVHGLLPVAVVLGAAALVRGRWEGDRRRQELVFLLTGLVALTALVQFPFGAVVYYFYAAPLVVLLSLALQSDAGKARVLSVVLLGAIAVFGAAYLDRMSIYDLHRGKRFVEDPQAVILDPDRASIRVYPWHAINTREVVRLLELHSSGRYTYAGPDLPQMYFLADLENPTRSLFDFLDLSNSARGDNLIRTLRQKHVTAVAISHDIQLSDPLEPATIRALRAMYPHQQRVDVVEVRWR
jgi:hypothetical protein